MEVDHLKKPSINGGLQYQELSINGGLHLKSCQSMEVYHIKSCQSMEVYHIKSCQSMGVYHLELSINGPLPSLELSINGGMHLKNCQSMVVYHLKCCQSMEAYHLKNCQSMEVYHIRYWFYCIAIILNSPCHCVKHLNTTKVVPTNCKNGMQVIGSNEWPVSVCWCGDNIFNLPVFVMLCAAPNLCCVKCSQIFCLNAFKLLLCVYNYDCTLVDDVAFIRSQSFLYFTWIRRSFKCYLIQSQTVNDRWND